MTRNDKESGTARSSRCASSRVPCRRFPCSYLVLWVSLLLPVFGTADEPKRFEFDSIRMGVPVRLVLYSAEAEKAEKAAEAAFERFRELDAVMSDYDSDSELSRLSQRRMESDEATVVSDDLFAVLKSAKHFSDISGGAFDVTVGPYTRLWRRSKRQRELPKPRYLDQARQLVGNHLWELQETTKSVRLLKPGVRFDLGGIAKGFAIDRAFEAILASGIDTVLVDAGGDFRLGKAPPGGWKIDLDGETVTMLENVAMATSGDRLRFVKIDGIRYSHIIDPGTGLGLTESSTVYVISSSATEADALASALSVLGPEKGIKLVEAQKNASAKIILHEGGRVSQIRCYCSQRWNESVPATVK